MFSGARAVGDPLSRRNRVGSRRPAAIWAWSWAVLVGLGVLAGPGSSWAAPSSPAVETPATAPATSAEGLPPIDETALSGPQLLDGVLPCGLRVILAQDETLPVAAVMLSLETGTEDDPPSQPGLVHALAYHLLQGNRELRPGGAPALVQDQGGIAGIAVGPAQVRYESLVPISALPDVLWLESQRLRAPTVSEELWTATLRWARRDTARAWRAPLVAMAAAHGATGLEHEGRIVGPGLDEMVPRAVGQALAERFRYDLATLVVVSSDEPAALEERIEALFADLPAQPRRARDRSPRLRPGTAPQAPMGGPSISSPTAAPRALSLAGETGTELVWPVAPDPASLEQATVWCKALNRQRRHEGEPARVRVRCHLDEDPRRATLVVEATGADDPVALVQGRLERLDLEDAPLVDRQRQTVLHEAALELRSPLPLSRRLAAAATEPEPPVGWRTRPVAALTGTAVLTQPWTGRRFGPWLSTGAAIHLVPHTAKPTAKPAKAETKTPP